MLCVDGRRAHFNPIITIAHLIAGDSAFDLRDTADALYYIAAQLAAAVTAALVGGALFGASAPLTDASTLQAAVGLFFGGFLLAFVHLNVLGAQQDNGFFGVVRAALSAARPRCYCAHLASLVIAPNPPYDRLEIASRSPRGRLEIASRNRPAPTTADLIRLRRPLPRRRSASPSSRTSSSSRRTPTRWPRLASPCRRAQRPACS